MEDISNMGKRSLEDLSKESLSGGEKRKIENDIIASFASLAALLAGFICEKLFPQKTSVAALIYLLGILIEGVPILITAIKGFASKNVSNAMEILVAIAIIACYFDRQFALAILVPVILNIVHFFEERSIMGGRDVIDGLKKMQSETAILFDPDTGEEKTVPAKELKCGQLIRIKPGCAVPADGTVISGESNIDQKSLTGEPTPAPVFVGDKVYAGTYNIDGLLTVKIEKEYNDTSFSKILSLLEDSENIQVPEARIIDKFMYYYIPLVLAIAGAVALATSDVSKAISILVVSCPCGHMLVSSAPMIAALAVSTKRGILIKNSKFIEQLCDVDTVVFDKTGTITEGSLNIASVEAVKVDENDLVALSASVSFASLHPVSKAVISLAREKGIEVKTAEKIKEAVGKGVLGYVGEKEIMFGSLSWMNECGCIGLEDLSKEPSERSGPVNYVAVDKNIIGRIFFEDSLRPEAPNAIELLREQGIKKTVVLTGDKSNAARKISEKAGIDETYAGLMPMDKLDKVKELKNSGRVIVVGDGINDALALKEANVGIAMGAMGSDTAIQSADIALMNNNLTNIPFVINVAKNTRKLMYQNIALAFSVSFVMIALSAFGVISALAGAFLHNIGAFVILINSSRLMKIK